jgi:hypothetical protein
VAAATAPAAVRNLRAQQLRRGLINQLVKCRRSLHWSQNELPEQSGIAQSEIREV